MKYLKLSLVIVLFLNSCQNTSKLWRGDRSYKETIQQFLIGKDAAKIVFIGTKYHYIFDDPESLRNILTWDNRSKIKIGYYQFVATSPRKIDGYIVLKTMPIKESSSNKISPLSETDLEFLKNNGFVFKKVGDENIEEKRFNLNGERYLPKRGVDYSKSSSPLIKDYQLMISESYNSASDKVEKILLTPIAMVRDTPTIVGGAIFVSLILVVVIPGMWINCAIKMGLSLCHE